MKAVFLKYLECIKIFHDLYLKVSEPTQPVGSSTLLSALHWNWPFFAESKNLSCEESNSRGFSDLRFSMQAEAYPVEQEYIQGFVEYPRFEQTMGHVL